MASELIHEIAELQQRCESLDVAQRRSLLHSAQSLVAALQTPGDRLAHIVYAEPLSFAAIRTLIDLRVFRLLAQENHPQSAAQLSQSTRANVELMARLLKQMASEFIVQETAPDVYAANELTRLLASPGGEGVVKDMFNGLKIAAELPAFFKKTDYANPNDKDATAWKYAFNTDLHYFEYIGQPGREEMLEAFKNHMATKTQGGRWFEDANVMAGILGNGNVASDDVLLIDIGGSSGYDLLSFKRAHTNMPGRLILQDLPATISSLDSKALAAEGIETMAYDMFTPQPVRNAKIYYSKMVLHDWPAEQCKQALAQLRPALKPGYSRILLNEIVIPEKNAHWFETSVDLLMMAVHSAQERREYEWRQLVESVDGLRVRKIWNVEGAVEKIIEIEAV